jgi:ribosome-dependent ATPase
LRRSGFTQLDLFCADGWLEGELGVRGVHGGIPVFELCDEVGLTREQPIGDDRKPGRPKSTASTAGICFSPRGAASIWSCGSRRTTRRYQSRELLENFSGSRYFTEHAGVASDTELDHRLKNGELKVAVEIPPNFGKDFLTDKEPEVSVWLDGAMPFRADTASGYVSGIEQTYLQDQATRGHIPGLQPPVNLEERFKYNQAFKSVYQTIPSAIMLVLILIPAMMTAVGVAREKETGSIANFRSTPITGIEFLLGKQLPYVAIGLASFLTLLLTAIYLFGVPVKGSLATLLAGVFIYIGAATAFGLLISCFVSTQIAAIFTTTILTMVAAINFSGLLVPFSSLSGVGRWIGLGFPSGWFTQISLGTFTKALGFADLWPDMLVLIVFVLAFVAAATIILRKQEA